MIAFKPPLIVQRAEDDKTQSSAEFVACCPAIGQEGHGHGQATPQQATPRMLQTCRNEKTEAQSFYLVSGALYETLYETLQEAPLTKKTRLESLME